MNTNEMPKKVYCWVCGREMTSTVFVHKYDEKTGRPIWRWKYKCPKFLFGFSHDRMEFDSEGNEIIDYGYYHW